MKEIDQPLAIYLIELALEFACLTLRPGGALLMKCFEGSGLDGVREIMRNNFKQLNNFKPKASRGKSREMYVLGRKLKSGSS
jgi:23S rRNA (uridine2552-2'-O)-methyltransferase